LPHTGGLALVIEGEMLSTFPTDEWIRLIEQTPGKITIRINSPGGNLNASLKLHETLKPIGHRVEILVAGCCGSAAILVLVAGDTRRAIEGSSFWLHKPSHRVHGDADHLLAAAVWLETYLQPMAKALCARCPADLVSKWLSGGDYFLASENALKVGLINQIEPAIEPLPKIQ
jgi:ATP-dependent Clp protease protease subunit